MSTPFRIAVVQMCSGTTPEPNLETIDTLVAEAAKGGAHYVLTPEMSVVFAENRESLQKVAAPFEGNPAIDRLSATARAHGIYLHLGSMAFALEDGRFANRSLLFAPDGSLVGQYDKIHLFDADLPGDKTYRESANYRGGDHAVVAQTTMFGLGFSICYDIRFGALYRALAEAGAEVIAVPAAFTVPTGRAHWEVLLRARAIETGCFVIAAAQGGQHENGRATYGHSMVVSPWGEVIAAADGDETGVIFADIDREAIGAARQRVPALANARPFTVKSNPVAAQ
jgi:deaminated glutathione amidase